MRAGGRRASSIATQPARPPATGPQESAAPSRPGARGIVDKQPGPNHMAAAVVVVVVVAGLEVPHLHVERWRGVHQPSMPQPHGRPTGKTDGYPSWKAEGNVTSILHSPSLQAHGMPEETVPTGYSEETVPRPYKALQSKVKVKQVSISSDQGIILLALSPPHHPTQPNPFPQPSK